MIIFLDCEYTDGIQCDLISIGMTDETGQHSFYAERSDYEQGWCNPFVKSAVLPLLDGSNVVTREELTAQLRTWFATLPRQVVIGCDDRTDWDLLLDALDGELPPNVAPQFQNLRHLIDTTVFNDAVCRYHDQPNQPWHHALHDAKAHRQGWMMWMASKSGHTLPEGAWKMLNLLDKICPVSKEANHDNKYIENILEGVSRLPDEKGYIAEDLNDPAVAEKLRQFEKQRNYPLAAGRPAVILFLDFDGVLHPKYIDAQVFSCTEHLWKILRACPDVDVVFSTSWRESCRLKEMVEFVTEKGGEDLAHRFIGQTPRIRANSDYEPRGLECQRWLEENGHSETPWLALDDVRLQFHGGHPNLYVVDGSTGLTEADVLAIIQRIQP